MKKKTTQSLQGLYTIGIAMVFLAGFLLLVIFGAITYRNTAASQTDNNNTRALLSYLVTSSKNNDAGSLSVDTSSYGDVLVISDGDTGYGLKIYCYEGSLVEEYNSLKAPLSPKDAVTIADSNIFTITTIDEHLLQVETDAGKIMLSVREKEAGE